MLIVYLIVGLLNSIGLLDCWGTTSFYVWFYCLYTHVYSLHRHHDIFSLPIAVSWITFNSIWYPLGVVLVFSIVQALEAYVIFPLQ
jgi:hypothetical protein